MDFIYNKRKSKDSCNYLISEFNDLFSKILKEQIDYDLPIPDKLEYDKVYRIEPYDYRFNEMRDKWGVSYIIKDKLEPFLDYYAVGDYYSVHNRINSKGEIIKLENFEGQFGRPFYPDDTKRTELEHNTIQDHNDKVFMILKSKRLEK